MQLHLEVLFYIALFVALIFFLRIFRKPLWFLCRILFRMLFGGALLCLGNTVGTVWGWQLAVNPVTAFLAGTLGLPGVGALSLLTLWIRKG